MKITELAKLFVTRWRAVAKIEAEELRQTSMELRFAQTAAAMGLWKGLGLLRKDDNDPELAEIRRRWVRLKEGK